MCQQHQPSAPQQQEQQQQQPSAPSQPWQSLYPDLAAMFPPPAPASPAASPASPWVSLLGLFGLQPIPQDAPRPFAPPAPEEARAASQSSLPYPPAGAPSHPQAEAPAGRPHVCGYSCGSPHISQLAQAIGSRLRHFTSVVTRTSATFFCGLLAFLVLSSIPGFLLHTGLYLVVASSLLGLPLPTLLASTMLYSFISSMHPLVSLMLLLPCLHRLHVHGLPLADRNTWGVRFTGLGQGCHGRRQ